MPGLPTARSGGLRPGWIHGRNQDWGPGSQAQMLFLFASGPGLHWHHWQSKSKLETHPHPGSQSCAKPHASTGNWKAGPKPLGSLSIRRAGIRHGGAQRRRQSAARFHTRTVLTPGGHGPATISCSGRVQELTPPASAGLPDLLRVKSNVSAGPGRYSADTDA